MDKDLQIYNELCIRAQEVFEWLLKQDERNIRVFKTFKSNNANALEKHYNEFIYSISDEFLTTPMTITVDTFSCEFLPLDVFRLMVVFKKLATGAKTYTFEYDSNEKVGDFQIAANIEFNNSTYAKKLTDSTAKDPTIPTMNHVLLEVNTSTNEVDCVASDGGSLVVISNSVETIYDRPEDGDTLRALFDTQTWKSICDLAKQNNNSVRFEFYKNEETEETSAIAFVGDKKFYSTCGLRNYPNWHKVTKKGDDKVRLTKQGQKAFNAFLKQVLKKDKESCIGMSYYKGNNFLYCEYNGDDTGIFQAFELEEAPMVTRCTYIKAQRLKKAGFVGFNFACAEEPSVIISSKFDYALVTGCWIGHDSDIKAYSIPQEVILERERVF